MIASGEASAVYCYNMARLSRSTHDLLELVHLADERGRAGSPRGRPVRHETATGRMLLTVLAAVDEMTADLASEHAKDAVAARRARGDRIGHPNYGERPGESVAAVVKAYQDAGSVLGAARLLNERKVPTRMGGPWGTTSVRDILIREGAMPHRRRPGAKARAPFVFYGLLRCHCGHILTGTRYKNGSDPPTPPTSATSPGRCRATGSRPFPRSVLEWAKDEAARVPARTPPRSRRRQAERDQLEARRARILDMYERGDLDRDEYGRRMRRLKADERRSRREADMAVLRCPTRPRLGSRRAGGRQRGASGDVGPRPMDAAMQPLRPSALIPEWWRRIRSSGVAGRLLNFRPELCSETHKRHPPGTRPGPIDGKSSGIAWVC